MKRNTLQELFRDHYEEIQYTLHPRKTEMENIDKMINCGALYSQKRSQAISFKLINCQHRHCVFTIYHPARLRESIKKTRPCADRIRLS